MDARPVRHFLAAYDAGTFAAAAERLGLTPQAVSKSILRLESELGVRLFERDGRRLRATAYAELFLPYARTVAAETDRFRADLSDMLGGRRGRLRVGVGPSAAAEVLAEAALAMTRARAGVTMRVLAGVQEQMERDLILGALDIFVGVRQVDRPDPLIREEELGLVRYVVVAGVGHALVGRADIGMAELSRQRWVMGANLGAVEQSIEASLRAAGTARFRIEVETTSVLFTLGVLERGEHLAILPEILVAREVRAGRLATLDVDTSAWTRPMVVATRVRGPESVQVALLIEQLRRAFAAAVA